MHVSLSPAVTIDPGTLSLPELNRHWAEITVACPGGPESPVVWLKTQFNCGTANLVKVLAILTPDEARVLARALLQAADESAGVVAPPAAE